MRTDTRTWTSVWRWRGGVGDEPSSEPKAASAALALSAAGYCAQATGGYGCSVAPGRIVACGASPGGLLRFAAAFGALAGGGIIKGATLQAGD